MKLKQAEFLSTEKNLKNSIDAISSLYKEDVKRQEKSISSLSVKKTKLNDDLNLYNERLSELKEQALRIDDIYVKGINEETLSDLNNVRRAIGERQLERSALNTDINIIVQYKNCLESIAAVEANIKECEQAIETVQQTIADKIKKNEERKAKFIETKTALVEKLCSYGNINVQKAKAKFAGKKVQLKGNLKDQACEHTLSVADLRMLNAIAILLDIKSELETQKAETQLKIELEEETNTEVNEDLQQLTDSFDEDALLGIVANKKATKKVAKTAKRKAAIMKMVGNIIYKKNEQSPIKVAISSEKQKQNAICKTMEDDIEVVEQGIVDSSKEINDKQKELNQSTSNLQKLRNDFEKLRNKLNVTDENALSRLRSLVDNPEIDILTGLEMILETLNKTAFEVNVQYIKR